jgi:hypothetical protein
MDWNHLAQGGAAHVKTTMNLNVPLKEDNILTS